ncbi:MAG: lipocalin-like domain-containing protein [Alphaproteobacteria bacterium]|nr:MAG: lipocalin-like domain-containing protein [Alphaproteobacteria bacterium]
MWRPTGIVKRTAWVMSGWGSAADKRITFHIDLSTYPNFNGTEQKRSFELVGDELKYTVTAFSGGGTAVAVWKRAK